VKSSDRPLVFVTVGTDHHQFDRLLGWVDAWLAAGAGDRVRCVVQNGTSRPPRLAEHRDYLSYQEIEAYVGEAAAVVCHGGPGSVMMCRWAGKKPIVVPRRHDLGEHVDDHQVTFARRRAREAECHRAEDEATLHSHLERALAGDVLIDLTPYDSGGEAVVQFERLVNRLVGQGPRQR